MPRPLVRWILAITLAAAGCTHDRRGPVQPVVLPDVTGHTALLIDHVGRYDLTTEPRRDIGTLPTAQLAISPSLSCHATWRAEHVEEVQVPETELVRLQATIIVDDLPRPVLAGYDLGWTRLGPPVIGLSGTGPAPTNRNNCPK